MIASGRYIVHADWSSNTGLFLWGERVRGGLVDPIELKNHLFAWHAPSFYGSFIETGILNQREGLFLSPVESIDFLCDTPQLEHAPLLWGKELNQLKQLAPHIRKALFDGQFMPDYRQWRQGTIGWKLDLPDDAGSADTPLVRQWTEALIADWVKQQPEHAQILRSLEERQLNGTASTLLTDRADSLWMDEDDWLVAIGWKHDATPFRTCLQLIEPEQELQDWQLQVLLQDKAHPELLYPCSDSGEALQELWPAEWPDVPARIARDIDRWLSLLPALARDAAPLAPAVPSSVEYEEAQASSYSTLAAPEHGSLAERHAGEHASASLEAASTRLRRTISHDEAWELLTQGSLLLIEAGYAVFLPAWWDRIRRLKPRLKARIHSSIGSGAESFFGLNQMMQFDWRLAIGDLELTESEFQSLAEQNRRLVHFRGRWIQLDPAQLAQIQAIMKRVNRNRGLSLHEVLEAHLLDGSAHSYSNENNSEEGWDNIQLEVELNDYLQQWFTKLQQQTDLPSVEPSPDFLGSLRPYQKQGLSWLIFLRQFGLGACLADDMGLGKTIQFITYLLHVRDHEAVKSPSLLVCPTSVLGNWQKELERFSPSLKVHLHYGPQRLRGEQLIEETMKVDLVLTSYTLAQLDKEDMEQVHWNAICLDEAQNIKNAYTKQARAIRQLQGYHRITLTGTPIENRLSELWSLFDFLNPGYLGTLAQFNHQVVQPIEKTKDPVIIRRVQNMIRPFLLRRVKQDPAIQLDLPEKSESNIYVTLTAEQATLYETYIQDLFNRLDNMTRMERKGMILSALTKLKQVCNHPVLMLKEDHQKWPERSNKLERLLDMVGELREDQDRCLIFTQFVETGHLVKRALQERLNEPVQFLHGGVPKQERDAMIARFQSEDLPVQEQCGIFLLSLKAGGIGLNLTAASHVFHFDRWWNPAVENQATDRAYRIGQTKHVQVHKFVTLGTLEERINEMLARKQGLSEQIVGNGENWITELSTDDLRELFLLRREWLSEA